jgi:hypothetical protein
LFEGLPHAVTLCGWLLPGPWMSVPDGAPRSFAIYAAVLPLPYRFEASLFDDVVDVHVAELSWPPPVEQSVFLCVVLLGFSPGCESDELWEADSDE